MDEYGNDIITLQDDDGKDYTFEILDAISTDDGRYIAMLPVFDTPKEQLDYDGDLVIAKVAEDENGEEFVEEIKDDDEYNTVADLFIERLSELYDIDEQ